MFTKPVRNVLECNSLIRILIEIFQFMLALVIYDNVLIMINPGILNAVTIFYIKMLSESLFENNITEKWTVYFEVCLAQYVLY